MNNIIRKKFVIIYIILLIINITPTSSIFAYYDPIKGRWLNRDPSEEKGGINLYSFCHNNSNSYIDFYGLFGIYVHTEGTGHVGIQTKDNSSSTNYDFGRYEGRYKWSIYAGPNILKSTTRSPTSLNKQGGKIVDFDVSKELDSIIAKKFRDEYESGSKDIPLNIKKKMKKYEENINFELPSNERYMRNDWGLTGPNCVSFTFSTLNEILDEVINNKEYPAKLKCEAEDVKKKIKEVKGTFTLTPSDVNDNLEEMEQE